MRINTYTEARNWGVYWDWNAIIQTLLQERTGNIAIKLLEKGVSIEKVYEATGLSAKARKLREKNVVCIKKNFIYQ